MRLVQEGKQLRQANREEGGGRGERERGEGRECTCVVLRVTKKD
jgi:hypothetical protein